MCYLKVKQSEIQFVGYGSTSGACRLKQKQRTGIEIYSGTLPVPPANSFSFRSLPVQ